MLVKLGVGLDDLKGSLATPTILQNQSIEDPKL